MTETTKTEMLNQIGDTWEELFTWIQQAKDFALEQAPDIIGEIIYREVASQSFGIVTLSAIAIACFSFSQYFTKKFEKTDNIDYQIGKISTTTLGVGLTFLMLVPIHELVMVLVAPKLFILDYLAKLVK